MLQEFAFIKTLRILNLFKISLYNKGSNLIINKKVVEKYIVRNINASQLTLNVIN